MKKCLIMSVFSLSLSSLAQAAELSVEQQCLALGYDTRISDCEAAGSAALICPLNNGSANLAVCITDSCQGYPLFRENGKFYYIDQDGGKVEAVPSKGQITDYMDGDFETCTAGYGDNAVTYYRVPKCKGEALYNDYFCDVGCDTEKKYPYTYHPGNTAGIVQKCVAKDKVYYGYSLCNKGWLGGWANGGIGKCNLDDCDMVDYPYSVEPNASYYKENRGKTEICKIGGATYYRYVECNGSDFVLKGVNTSDKKGTVCARKCPVTNCTNTPFMHTYPNGDTAEINDWSCKIKNTRCTLGDIATFNGKEIGVIVNISEDKIFLVPVNYVLASKSLAKDVNAGTQEFPQLTNHDTSTSGKIQTNGILIFGKQTGYEYPVIEYCLNYSTCSESFCASPEWYLPSVNEMDSSFKAKYLVANVMGDRNFPTACFYTSSQQRYDMCILRNANGGCGASKTGLYKFLPMLSFRTDG